MFKKMNLIFILCFSPDLPSSPFPFICSIFSMNLNILSNGSSQQNKCAQNKWWKSSITGCRAFTLFVSQTALQSCTMSFKTLHFQIVKRLRLRKSMTLCLKMEKKKEWLLPDNGFSWKKRLTPFRLSPSERHSSLKDLTSLQDFRTGPIPLD